MEIQCNGAYGKLDGSNGNFIALILHFAGGKQLTLSQPAEDVLAKIVIPLSRNKGLLPIPAFRKGEFTRSPAVGQCLLTSDVRDVVSRVLQTSLIQLIFGPSIDKWAIYILVQLDDRVEM